MTRPHDMGGRFGDGAVVPEPEGEIFHADWHPRALALTVAAGFLGHWNIDMSRRARENLSPKDYARFSYYEKWLSALADILVERDLVTPNEFSGAEPSLSPIADKVLTKAGVPAALSRGGPTNRSDGPEAVFSAGDTVVTRRVTANRLVEGGHTRLPRYAAGATGRIVRCHGAHVLPDSNAHGLGEAPEPLYSVAFPASELWANPEHPRDEVVIDLWQSYLEHAS